MIQQMLAVWSLIPLPFLNPAWTSGSWWFMYCWSLAWRILSITLLVCEMSAIVQYFEQSLTTQISHRYSHVPFLLEAPSHLVPHHAPLGCHGTLGWALFHTPNSHLLSILHMVMYIFPCYSLNLSHSLLLPLCPQVCSLYLHLHCCPANRFISTIFLDSIGMH